MFYEFACDRCGLDVEVEMGMNDEKKHDCECGRPMRRVYSRFDISGDVLHRYDYFDETLGVQVTSKAQREDEMKRQGLRQHEPEARRKELRKEVKYIRKHAKGKEAEGEIKGMRKSLSKQKRDERMKPLREAAKKVAIEAIKEKRNG